MSPSTETETRAVRRVVERVMRRLVPLLEEVSEATHRRAVAIPRTQLRPGTVVGYDPSTGDASVTIDGDDQPVAAQVLGYAPAPNDRVQVLFDPPHGIFVLGHVGGAPNGGTGPAGATGATGAAGAAGAPGPSIGRIEVSGHSYAAENINGPYGQTNPQDGDETRDEAGWADLVRDVLTPAGATSRYRAVVVPPVAAGADFEQVLGLIPEDAVIEGIWYIPNAALTGAATNTRKVEVQVLTFIGLTTFGFRQFDAGVNLVKATAQGIVTPQAAGADLSVRPKSNAGALYAHAWAQSSLVWELGGTGPRPNVLNWKSTHVGTGLADPGGIVLIRYGTKFIDIAQGGALALMGGVHMGGWSAQTAAHRPPQDIGVQVCSTGTLAANGTGPLAVQLLGASIPNGWKIRMSGGATLTVNDAGVTNGDSAITILADGHAAVAAGEQGFATPGTVGDAYAAWASHLVVVGVNDAPWWSPLDRVAWREVVRFWIALKCCPMLFAASNGNTIYANGSGVIEDYNQPAAGQWELLNAFGFANAFAKRVRSGNGWTITIRVAPDFPGGFIDLFWAALAGTGRGIRASITLDGVAAGTLDTSSASPTANVSSGLLGTTLTGVTFITGSGYNQTMIGRRIEHAAVPVGSIAGFVNDAGTAITITNPVTGAAVGALSDQTNTALTVRGYVPMVKRIAAAAGAHTVVMTGTTMDATDGTAAAVFLEHGWEVPTKVLFADIPTLPNGSFSTEIGQLNTDTAAVIAGTAAAVGTGSVEPALGSLVELWPLNALLAANAANFLGDSLHPNLKGNRLIAEDAIARLRALTVQQQLAR